MELILWLWAWSGRYQGNLDENREGKSTSFLKALILWQ